MPNYNPTTKLPYGCIALSELDDDVAQSLFVLAIDATIKEAREREGIPEDDDCDFDCEEPSAIVTLDGVTGWVFRLGGADLFLSIDGPPVKVRSMCSPCVPGAADLNSGKADQVTGYPCHGVPSDWMAQA